jgi:uncharacterized protein
MAASAQSLGGRARAKRLSRDERRRIASFAARARWADPRKVLEDRALIADFCHKYGLQKLYAFGSILTPSFGKGSDVDLLYVAEKPLDYAVYCDAVDELRSLFGRTVDLVNKQVIEHSANEFRRRAILGTARPIYEAR